MTTMTKEKDLMSERQNWRRLGFVSGLLAMGHPFLSLLILMFLGRKSRLKGR
jgi:hypothetical protein